MANNITNLKSGRAVNSDSAADITAIPTVTDIGVPTEGLTKNAHNVGAAQKRLFHNPAFRTPSQKGIGVPQSPVDGVITD